MRKLASLLLALGLLIGVAGTAIANCGGQHADTTATSPTTTQPLPRT
jgi:hypothetical protein